LNAQEATNTKSGHCLAFFFTSRIAGRRICLFTSHGKAPIVGHQFRLDEQAGADGDGVEMIDRLGPQLDQAVLPVIFRIAVRTFLVSRESTHAILWKFQARSLNTRPMRDASCQHQ
jgi:hypothetical protein